MVGGQPKAEKSFSGVDEKTRVIIQLFVKGNHGLARRADSSAERSSPHVLGEAQHKNSESPGNWGRQRPVAKNIHHNLKIRSSNSTGWSRFKMKSMKLMISIPSVVRGWVY